MSGTTLQKAVTLLESGDPAGAEADDLAEDVVQALDRV